MSRSKCIAGLVLSVFLKAQSPADVHTQRGYALFKENKPKESLSEYEQAARYRAPTAVDLEVIGCDYFLLEDYGKADKWLTQSVAQDHSNALALYFLGRTKYNEKYFEQAVQLFVESLKLDPKNAKTQQNLGLAYERLGKADQAIAAYKSAIDLDPTAAGPYLNLGMVTGAIPYLLKAVQLAPNDAQAHRELGKAYLLSNQLEPAQRELEAAAGIDPQNAPTHYLLSQVYRKRGLTASANAEAARYTELSAGHSSPDDPLAEARSLIQLGKLQDAEQVIRHYIEVHRNSADAHYLLGYLLFKKQDARASLAEYTEGAKFRTPDAHDLEVVGGDYVLLHDYSDADKWFSKSVEWDPDNLQTLYYLGRAKYNENRFDEAMAVFQRVLKADPTNVKAEDNLGLSYQGLGRVEDAMAAYRTAIEWEKGQVSKDAGPYVNLGSALVDSDRPREGLPYLQEAAQIAPGELRVHRALGKAYLHLNQLDKAQQELEKGARLAPQNASIHFMLAQVYRKQGQEEKARLEAARYTALAGAHSSDDE